MIKGHLALPPFKIAGIIVTRRSRADKKNGMKFDMEITKKSFFFGFEGYMECLGMKMQANMIISTKGTKILMDGTLFGGFFSAKIKIVSGPMTDPKKLSLKVDALLKADKLNGMVAKQIAWAKEKAKPVIKAFKAVYDKLKSLAKKLGIRVEERHRMLGESQDDSEQGTAVDREYSQFRSELAQMMVEGGEVNANGEVVLAKLKTMEDAGMFDDTTDETGEPWSLPDQDEGDRLVTSILHSDALARMTSKLEKHSEQLMESKASQDQLGEST